MNFNFLKRFSIYRFATILIIIYSTLLAGIGLFCLGAYCYDYYSNSFMKYLIAEFVDINNWLLNMYGINFLIISAGLVGIIAGGAIWKKREWGRRLWLGLISWQMIQSFIPVGYYAIGQPDFIWIAIVWSLGIFSWFVFCKKSIRGLFNYEKIFAFVPILAVLLVTNIFTIVWLYIAKPANLASLKQIREEAIGEKIEQAMINAVKNELLGECYKELQKLYELHETKDVDGVIEEGERLIKKGHKNDRFVLLGLAEAYYAKGDKLKVAELLEAAKDGKYLCEITKVSERFLPNDEAFIHYKLYLVYNELGMQSKSEHEYQQAVGLFKDIHKEKFSKKVLANIERASINGLNYFNKDNGD
jgi:tetratricopeptide (TPR) repeat protein